MVFKIGKEHLILRGFIQKKAAYFKIKVYGFKRMITVIAGPMISRRQWKTVAITSSIRVKEMQIAHKTPNFISIMYVLSLCNKKIDLFWK